MELTGITRGEFEKSGLSFDKYPYNPEGSGALPPLGKVEISKPEDLGDVIVVHMGQPVKITRTLHEDGGVSYHGDPNWVCSGYTKKYKPREEPQDPKKILDYLVGSLISLANSD